MTRVHATNTDAFPLAEGATALRIEPTIGGATTPVRVQGSKNTFLTLMVSVFAGRNVMMRMLRVPRISDRNTVRDLLAAGGYEVVIDSHYVHAAIGSPGPSKVVLPPQGSRLRHTISYAAALAAKAGMCITSLPGGDAFTLRPIDLHLRVLESAGAFWSEADGLLAIEFRRPPRPFEISLRTPFGPDPKRGVGSLGATITALHVAVCASGMSRLSNVPDEPEIRASVALLRQLGVGVEWADPETLEVVGLGEPPSGSVEIELPPDRIEAGTYLLAGLARQGRVDLADVAVADLPSGFVGALTEAGITVRDCGGRSIGIHAEVSDPRPISVATAPHPGFPTDLQPQLCAFLTQSSGTSTVCETMYRSRATHIGELGRLGLSLTAQGRSFVISGPQSATGGTACVHDIRCGAALLVAAAAGTHPTVLYDAAGHLRRGYGDLVAKLDCLGLAAAWLEEGSGHAS